MSVVPSPQRFKKRGIAPYSTLSTLIMRLVGEEFLPLKLPSLDSRFMSKNVFSVYMTLKSSTIYLFVSRYFLLYGVILFMLGNFS